MNKKNRKKVKYILNKLIKEENSKINCVDFELGLILIRWILIVYLSRYKVSNKWKKQYTILGYSHPYSTSILTKQKNL